MTENLPQTKLLLAEKIQQHREKLDEWFGSHATLAPPPFYCSVDLRDSGHKIVPVDSNLFPAGFNNLCPEDLKNAPPVVRAQIEAFAKRAGANEIPKRVLILPESHTQNLYYIENLYRLHKLLELAGFESAIGWYGALPEGMTFPLELKSASGKTLAAFPIEIVEGKMKAGDFTPDLILLNNDFSGGYPEALDQVTQPIFPSYVLGWHSRKKSEHFRHYNRLATEFAQIIGADPWAITIDTECVEPVNFNEDIGTDLVAESVNRIMARMAKAHHDRFIDEKPFVFVKNNSGTYGMGVMVVHSVDEITRMNRRTKNKMSVGKNRSAIESVVIQEGVRTAMRIDEVAAEPVIYCMGGELIGGFLRANTERGDQDNLNSQGMVFKKLCMSDLKRPLPALARTQEVPVLELVYGSVARISALAMGLELAEHLGK